MHGDNDSEVEALKIWAVALLLFLVSMFKSCTEMRYFVWGKTVDAEVVRLHETSDTTLRGDEVVAEPALAVHYTFTDTDGTQRKEYDFLARDLPAPHNGKIAVQYIPGRKQASRIVGNSKPIWLWIFGLSIAACLGMVVYLHRQAHKPVRSFAHERRLKQRKRRERSHKKWIE